MSTNLDDRTALSDRAVSYLRTAVPALWGAGVATLLRVLGPHLPAGVGDQLEAFFRSETVVALAVTGSTVAWYWVWRRVERRIPDWVVRVVLGSARTPGYPLPGEPLTLTADERQLIEDVRAFDPEGRASQA